MRWPALCIYQITQVYRFRRDVFREVSARRILKFLNWNKGFVSRLLETLHRNLHAVTWLESNQAIFAFKCRVTVWAHRLRRRVSSLTDDKYCLVSGSDVGLAPVNFLCFFVKTLSSGYHRDRCLCNLTGQLAVSRLFVSSSFVILMRLSGVSICFGPHRWAKRKRIVLMLQNCMVRKLGEELGFNYLLLSWPSSVFQAKF